MKSRSLVGTATLCLWAISCSPNPNSTDLEKTSCTEIGNSLIEHKIDPESFNPQYDKLVVGLTPTSEEPQDSLLQGLRSLAASDAIQTQEDLLEIHLSQNEDRTKLLGELLENHKVRYVEPDFMYKAQDLPSISSTAQWAHQNIKTPQAWEYSEGSSELVVAVIDSGVDFAHPDLTHSKWRNENEILNGKDDDRNGYVDDLYGWNYVEKNNRPYPTYSTSGAYHGTHVAGIIAGRHNSSRGTSGVAPKVKIMALKTLDENKTGYSSNGVKAVYYAIRNGAKVINASWGSFNKSVAMQEALREAKTRGVLVIAASGNSNNDNDIRPFYPASYSYSNLLSVTASTRSNSWLRGINYGNRTVDIAAPGSSILSTDRGKTYKSRSGSSMAAPYVAGVAALALSVNPDLNPTVLAQVLKTSSDTYASLKSRVSSSGRLNALETTLKAITLRYSPPSEDEDPVEQPEISPPPTEHPDTIPAKESPESTQEDICS